MYVLEWWAADEVMSLDRVAVAHPYVWSRAAATPTAVLPPAVWTVAAPKAALVCKEGQRNKEMKKRRVATAP